MSECKISNCAFYTCCYGKTNKQMVVGFGQWGEMGYSQLFWSCIFIHVYFLNIINNILKICLLTNSDNGPVLAIVHPSNKIKALLWTAYFWWEG